MSAISTWSTTAADNDSASPDGFKEGMAPSGVNNSAREVMAQVRAKWEDAEWFDYGHTVTYSSATEFTIASDVTSIYATNRRIKCTDSSTLYGYVTNSTYSSPNTTVTVSLDSGNLSASLSAVAVGILSPSNESIPHNFTPPFDDSNSLVRDTSDSTKLLRVDCGNITSGNTRVLTMADSNVDLANATFPISDSTSVVKNAADSTKQVRIDAGNITTGNTRVLTMPDEDVSLSFVSKALLQQVYTTSASVTSCNTIPSDDTIPQNTEGTEIITLSITPTSATSILKIEFVSMCVNSSNSIGTIALFQDSTTDAIHAIANNAYYRPQIATLTHYMTAGTTSSTTFKIRAGSDGGNFFMNTSEGSATRQYGGVAKLSFQIIEFAQ